MPKFERITFNRNIMAGQACIRGMRITAALVLNLIANGKSQAEILHQYPDLEPDDIRQVLAYAAWPASEHVYSEQAA